MQQVGCCSKQNTAAQQSREIEPQQHSQAQQYILFFNNFLKIRQLVFCQIILFLFFESQGVLEDQDRARIEGTGALPLTTLAEIEPSGTPSGHQQRWRKTADTLQPRETPTVLVSTA